MNVPNGTFTQISGNVERQKSDHLLFHFQLIFGLFLQNKQRFSVLQNPVLLEEQIYRKLTHDLLFWPNFSRTYCTTKLTQVTLLSFTYKSCVNVMSDTDKSITEYKFFLRIFLNSRTSQHHIRHIKKCHIGFHVFNFRKLDDISSLRHPFWVRPLYIQYSIL